jgi:hypothetical protein
MSDTQDTLTVLGRHVPDVSVEKDERGQPFQVALPGTYEVGVEVAGQFLVLQAFKAGNFLKADGSAVNPPEEKPAESPSVDSDGNPA